MAGGEVRLMISLLSIECRVPSKRALDEKWIFSQVDKESIGGPMTSTLDLVQRSAGKHECGGTT